MHGYEAAAVEPHNHASLGALIAQIPTVQESEYKNSCFTEMYSGSEEVSYLRRIDFCITQL